MNISDLIIAIDGHSSSGKSTIAKELAAKIGLKYIDTGAMYRGITLKLVQNKVNLDNLEKIEEILLSTKIDFTNKNGKNVLLLDDVDVENQIRGLEVADNVSEVSTIPIVRDFLVKMQREMGKSSGLVMDGRDIGTVVFPNANIKFFVTADVKVRAKRRFDELVAKGDNITYESVLSNLEKRDKIDSTREHSPLKKAEDAIVIDTENFTQKTQLEYVLNKVKEYIKNHK